MVLKYDETFILSNVKDIRNAFYMKIKWPTLTKKKKWTDQLKSTSHFARTAWMNWREGTGNNVFHCYGIAGSGESKMADMEEDEDIRVLVLKYKK